MKIHFVGSEGVSMKVLMRIMHAYGHTVTGSDITLFGHDEKNVENVDLVVYTSAVGQDNIEVRAAREKKIEVIERAEFLGSVAANYSDIIAVSGSHGKTTVTGFLQQIFVPLDATVHIGGNALNENGHVGGGKYFITEACEYRRSFLFIKPSIALVLNMELDHTDYYRDIDDYVSAFESFCAGAREVLVYDADPNRARLGANAKTFGENKQSFYSAQNIVQSGQRYSFEIYKKGDFLFNACIKLCGRHNVINALAAAAAALECGVEPSLIQKGLAEFEGVKRRFEYKCEYNGARIFSDYAHHPSELKTTIQSARSLSKNRVTIVFEPHTFSRTKSLHEGFVESLSLADRVVLVPIYPARETPIEDVTSHNIVLSLQGMAKNAVYFDAFSTACRYIKQTAKSGEIIVFAGAGDIDKAAKFFMENLC